MTGYTKGVKEGIRMAAMVLLNPQKWIAEFRTYEDEIKILLAARDTVLKASKPAKSAKTDKLK